MILSHRIALDPTAKQRIAFCRACGVARYAYNWALAEWKRQYEAGEKPNALALKRQWNQEKPKWVYDSPKDANQAPFAHLQSAFQKFFKKRANFPQFKCKGVHDCFSVSNDKFQVSGKRVRLPRIGTVRMREALRFDGKIVSGAVSRDADRWFLSVAVDAGPKYSRPRTGSAVIGVDLGVKSAATLSTGEHIEGPKPLRLLIDRMKTLQRRLSRKQKGSKNRVKAKAKVSRLHRRIRCVRSDFLHKLTTRLCRENQTAVIEDLNVRGMMANHKLARAISDIGFHEFRRQLQYKGALHGTIIVVADRWFPSTKTCHRCAAVVDMPLSERTFHCDCGYTEDRDINAALNLRTLGLRGINACGHGSSGSQLPSGVEPQNETTVVEAGTTPCSPLSTK